MCISARADGWLGWVGLLGGWVGVGRVWVGRVGWGVGAGVGVGVGVVCGCPPRERKRVAMRVRAPACLLTSLRRCNRIKDGRAM